MVWAATKLTIWDYIYRDIKAIEIEYKGKKPQLLYKKIKELIKDVFRVPEGGFQEKKYTWNKTETGEEFEAEWEAIHQLDDFSYLMVRISLKGFSSAGVGKASITYQPILITEYPQDTFWQQNILYELIRRLWHAIFYKNKRNEFFEMGREMSERFDREIKDFIEKLK